MVVESVAVLGLGTMGQGIAVVAAAAGVPVRVFDTAERLSACVEAVRRRYRRVREAAGEPAGPEPELVVCGSLGEAVAGADLVIEAVPERLELKRALFGELELAAGAVLATNTSSLPLAALESAVAVPERFLATHFFNPAELVPGVEVAAGSRTDPEVVAAVSAFLRAAGKEPVTVGARAGFVANRLQLALFLEAMACVADGVASREDVDTIVRRTFGFRLPAYGPFAIADMAGLDVYRSILEVLAGEYGDRFAVPDELRELVAQGRLGAKAGAGFRAYEPAEVDALVAERDSVYRRLLRAAAR